MSELNYGNPVTELIEDATFECNTHGELELEDLSLTLGGRIVCEFCSLNQEMDTRNEMDIDPVPEVDFND